MEDVEGFHGLELAKEWFSLCTSQHASCGRNYFVPTRLIEIGDQSTPPRLREKGDLDAKVKYMTLSHCWGQHVPVMLLKSNLERMKSSIAFDGLSRVFQEAIIVARYLGGFYIWIDCLCIIQDSVEDWNRESAQMCDVYAGSCCNIAATACSNGTESLLSRRGLPKVPLEVRISADYYRVEEEMLWQELVEDSPLCQRAWACQERLLCSRNLHFGSSQLLWECDHHLLCETYPAKMPQQIHNGTYTRLNPTLFGSKGPAHGDSKQKHHKKDPYEVWGMILPMYTKGLLTRESDKLVAISGLASKMNGELHDDYLAGLWKRDLPSQLCWKIDRQYTSSRPQGYLAPSWSWASVTGRVRGYEIELNCGMYDLDIQINILDVHVDLVSSLNPFGQVSGGSVRVSGRLAPLSVEATVVRGQCNVKLHLPRPAIFESKLFYPDVVMSWEESGHGDIYCLPLLSAKDQSRCEAMLLRAAEAVKGHFRRFGILQFRGKEEVKMLNDACRHFDETTQSSGLGSGKDSEGRQKYDITIL